MEDIRKTIADYIKNEFGVDDADRDFTYDVNLFDYGYVDSLGAATIISFIEATYNIEVTQKDLMLYSLSTINEIAEFAEKRLGIR